MSLRLEKQGTIAHLLIDRSDKRNAFTQAMWLEFPKLLAQAMADDGVKAMVLRSAEAGIFCAGADIKEFGEGAANPNWRAANQAAISRTQIALARAEKPVIVAVDGDCVGGGCGLAIAGDIRIASSRSRFGITPAKLGLVYSLHDTKLLVDLVGPAQAKRILFTAQLLPAEEALRIGLVEMIADDPLAAAQDMAETMASVSSHSIRNSKKIIRHILDGQAEDDAETEALFGDAFTSADFQEGVCAFLEKRRPNFR